MAANREDLIRRLEASVYVAREGGLSREEILEVVNEGIANAEAARPVAGELLQRYHDRFGHAA